MRFHRRWATLFFLFALGCTAPLHSLPEINALDAAYRSHSLPGSPAASASLAARIYREGVSPTLGAECRWLPSDSAFVEKTVSRCPAFPGVVRGIARYLSESDAHTLASGVVIARDRLSYFDFPNACD